MWTLTQVLQGACKGVAYLHSLATAHGDLRPHNILLKREGAAGGVIAKIAITGAATPSPTGPYHHPHPCPLTGEYVFGRTLWGLALP